MKTDDPEEADESHRLDGRLSTCPVHPRAWDLFKKRKSVSKEAWNESSLLQVQHKSLKAIFESEPEEEHDDQQVAFQVQSQQDVRDAEGEF